MCQSAKFVYLCSSELRDARLNTAAQHIRPFSWDRQHLPRRKSSACHGHMLWFMAGYVLQQANDSGLSLEVRGKCVWVLSLCRLFSFEGCATAHTGPQPAGLANYKSEPRHKIQACHGHAIVCLVNGNAAFSRLQTNSRQLFASRNFFLQNQIT